MAITFSLTSEEFDAVRWCIGQMTDGNACDIDEMMLCGMDRKEARALLIAERKMIGAAATARGRRRPLPDEAA